MYTPINNSLFATITPVDVSLHTFLGLSWHILLPYTVFGGVLMAYSQSRLMRGQRDLKRAEALSKTI